MKSNKTAFLFPGQGSCSPELLRDILTDYPEYKNLLTEADSVSQEFFGKKVSDFISSTPSDQTGDADQFPLIQVTIFLTNTIIHHILISKGIQPDMVVGHSFGEISALCVSGVFSFETGLKLVCYRTQALEVSQVQGGMIALSCNAMKAQKLIDLTDVSEVYVSNENSPLQTILSGSKKDLEKIQQTANSLAISNFYLSTQYPFHCRLMGPSVNAFYEMAQGNVEANAPKIPVFSPLKQAFYNEKTDLFEHICRHLFVRKVCFQDSINALYRQGVRNFIEVGGRKALTGLTKEILKDVQDVLVISTDDSKVGGRAQLAMAIETVQKFQLQMNSGLDMAHVSLSPLLVAPSVLEMLADEQLLSCALTLLDELKHRKVRDLPKVSEAVVVSPDAPPPPPPPAAPLPPPTSSKTSSRNPAEVKEQVLTIYQTTTEYPVEVLELDVDLEAELGLDSVKQLQILAKIQEHFLLPQLTNLQIKNYNTIRKVIEMVLSA